jgi:carboxyl-terminal processing protease
MNLVAPSRLSLLRFVLPAVATAVLGLTPGSARAGDQTRQPPSCADAWAIIDFAVARHVVHDRLTPELATRARDLLADALIDDHPWLSTEETSAIKARASAISAEALLAERAAGRCDHLDTQVSLVKAALARAADLFPSPDLLAGTLPSVAPAQEPVQDGRPPLHAAGVRALLTGDALAEAWRVRGAAEWSVARAFGARRALRWLNLARQRLAGRGAADLINAFAHALDPHSRYETEEEADHSDRELNPLAGLLGLEFGDPVPGGVPVTGLHPGSPAARQRGMRVGDVITAVGATSVADLDAGEISSLLDSYEEVVPLTFARPAGRKLGPARRIQLHRQVLQDRNMSVTATPRVELGRRVLVARVDEVDQDTADGVERALHLQRRSPDAVVLDLRGCTGGYLTTSVAIAGLFLSGGPVVRVHKRGAQDEVMNDPARTRAYSGPLVVLVDEETASGCEIVAGALRVRGRALVVGTARTFGKGTMQDIFDGELPTGALYVTTGLFFLPDGTSPQGTGVPVDLIIGPPTAGVVTESSLSWALPPPAPARPLEGGDADRVSSLPGALERLAASTQQPWRPPRAGTDEVLLRATRLAARLAASPDSVSPPVHIIVRSQSSNPDLGPRGGPWMREVGR